MKNEAHSNYQVAASRPMTKHPNSEVNIKVSSNCNRRRTPRALFILPAPKLRQAGAENERNARGET
jgi:hypothetical protein